MTGQQMKQSGMLRIFASYYKPHWKLFALDMVCALVICVMLTIRWELALIVFAVIPLFVAFTAIQRKRMAEASREVYTSLLPPRCRRRPMRRGAWPQEWIRRSGEPG